MYDNAEKKGKQTLMEEGKQKIMEKREINNNEKKGR